MRGYCFIIGVLLATMSNVSQAQSGALDPTFNAGDIGFGSGIGASGIIYKTLIQADGKILICGNFSSYNGFAVNRIARLNPNGQLDFRLTQEVQEPIMIYIP
jgi:hypothetical protein